ncbi:TonB-dependent receptor domain-containing protein [Phenylobacterium immobile]|uniref:TonB-dependent receptor domain-containing protein n=1 Tax=Phenylobacterium immobile TaxID=21 RepID=UPI001147419A|nr:TonB-dependent receptor [Phenylobacterium immobile]
MTLAITLGAPTFAAAQTAEEAAPAEAELESVVVTASRIVRDGYEAPTPTTVVGVAELQKQSVPNIANYVNMLPQLGSGAGASPRTTNFAAGNLGGVNAFNMRNLTTVRTLTLLDGHRVVGANLAQIVDTNLLPTNLVSRVDVVTGGASAAWGSDAVAGVVNFVLDKTFTGVKGQMSGGQSWKQDGTNLNADLAAGFRFAEGRGHVLLSGRVETEQGITGNGSRDWFTGYKAVPNKRRTATNGQPGFIAYNNAGLLQATTGGVIVSGPLAGVQFGPGGSVLPYRPGTEGSGLIGWGGDVEDIADDFAITPDTRNASLFGRVSYDLTDDVNMYLEVSKGWSYGMNLTSPFIRHGDMLISADNPFIPAGLNLRGETQFRIGRVMNEEGLGLLRVKNTRNQTRGLLGLEGKTDWFDSSFKWNAYYQHGETHQYQEFSHNTILGNFNRAIDVVRNPAVGGVAGVAVGAPVCRSTITNPTNRCQPFNVFGAGSPSQAAIDYVTEINSFQDVYIKQDVAQAGFQFEPFSLPAGAVSLAAGAEYRRESYYNTVDALDAATPLGQAAFWFGNFRAGRGVYNVKEAFAEVIVPVLKDVSFVKSLDLNGALRVTDYSTSGRVETWKVGGTWDVNDDLRFRGTRSRDIRAPNLNDLFLAGAGAGIGVLVPGTNTQVYALSQASGNPTLTPEIADTTAFGVVYRPSWLSGFSVSADRYTIKINDAIITQTPQQVVNFCYGVGGAPDPAACRLIILNPNPTSPGLAGQLTDAIINNGGANIAEQQVAGWDFEIGYRKTLADFNESLPGSIDLRAVGSYLTKFTLTSLGTTQNLRGMVFPGVMPVAGGPKWRWLVTGSYALGPSTTTLTVRYIGKAVVNNEPLGAQFSVLQNDIRSQAYLDINQSWNLKVRGVESTIFAKIENVFDADPPKVASTQGTAYAASGSTGEYYDLIGRYWRVGIRFKY